MQLITMQMRVETTMKDLCRKCEYFDESKVENKRYLCPQMNMTIWYGQEYVGCGVFKAKAEAKKKGMSNSAAVFMALNSSLLPSLW